MEKPNLEEFASYCFAFYGIGGIFAGDFAGGFPYKAVEAAALLVMETSDHYEGDSIDREEVRRVLEAAPARQNGAVLV